MEKFGCLGLLVILLGLLVVWGTILNIPNAGECNYFDFFFDFIPWKPTDTWPRDRCGRR